MGHGEEQCYARTTAWGEGLESEADPEPYMPDNPVEAAAAKLVRYRGYKSARAVKSRPARACYPLHTACSEEMGRFKWSAAEKFWNMPAYNSESEDDSEESDVEYDSWA
jgi:hypothetical protein